MLKWIKRQKNSILLHFILAKYHETSIKKKEYNNIIQEWHDKFKMPKLKRRNFLNLLNNNLSDIESLYSKGEP